MMKKIVLGCIGAGLAVGGAYLLYNRWQKYQQQCQEKNNEPTLEKSEHFIQNFDKGIMERDGLSVCAKKTGENASHEGKTDTTNVHQKQGLDCQICHEETLKPENATAIKDKAEHDVQPILGAKFVRIPLKGTDIDEDALYGEMNEFFASLLEAGAVSHTDSEQIKLEVGQIFQPGPSSDPNRDDQANGAGTKKASKQFGNRRRRTRKHNKN